MRMVTRKKRRWNYISMDQIHEYARTTTSESVWNDAFEHPMIVSSDALVGKKLTFIIDNGEKLTYEFADERHLSWKYSDGHGSDNCVYNAAPAPGYDNIFYIHHYRETYDVPACTDLIFDFNTGHVVYFDAKLGLPENPREIDRTIKFGQLEGTDPGVEGKPEFTDELVGKCIYWKHPDSKSRGIKYMFSSAIYLTYVMYHKGDDEAWMATHPCDYVKFNKDLFIASTIEERQAGPQLVMLMNLNTMTDCQTGFGIGCPAEGVDRIETWMRSGRHAEWTEFPTYFD